MNFTNHLSDSSQIDQIFKDLNIDSEHTYQLGILFYSQQSQKNINDVVNRLNTVYKIEHIIGCSCCGVISGGQEIEYQSAISLLLMSIPKVKVKPFSITQQELKTIQSNEDWYQFFDIYPNEKPTFIVLSAPLSFDINQFLNGINIAYKGSPIVGGLASASTNPKGNTLLLNQYTYNDGLVGVILRSNIQIVNIVSQGCRPIGKTFIITKAKGNVIYELAGKSFIKVLTEVLDTLAQKEKKAIQENLFVGIAISEYAHEYRCGDFLIRGLLAVDHKIGAGLIGDRVQTGQTIQFQIRDAQTALEDLNNLLAEQKRIQIKKVKGALIFTCNGRGEMLFKTKNQEISLIQNYLGPIAAAGFFCSGEIGPIGKINFIHGFTNSIALFIE